MSDPGTTYRTRDEVQKIRKERDPLAILRYYILQAKFASEEDLKAIDSKAREEVEAAAEKAKGDPEPSPDTLFKDVYVDGPEMPYLRGCEPSQGRTFM